MHHSRFRRLFSHGTIAAIAIVSLGLSACGAGGSTAQNKDLILASDLPVSGTDGGDGLPTQQGVQLAVMQNANLGSGYTLRFEGKDDVSTSSGAHDPGVGATNVTALVGDPKVIAMVGPFNSSVAGTEIPIVDRSGLVEISPANTNPGLTLQQYSSDYGFNFNVLHPAGRKEYYFRIPGNDVSQGKIDAKISLNLSQAGGPVVHKVFVVDDNEAYGKGLADQYTKELQAEGGSVVGTRQSITASQSATFNSIASNIVAAGPDLVFYGGVTSGGGGVLKQATDAAFAQAGKTPVLWEGGDGIADDPSWLTAAGASSIGTLGTVAAPDVATLGKASNVAATFISAFKTQFNADPIPYSAMAYDAAMIEIQAIKSLISAGKPVTRDNVRDAVASISYSGATGTISFDQYGDNAGTKVFSVWASSLVGGKPTWVFQQDVTA